MEIENDNHQKQSLPVTGDSVRTDSEQKQKRTQKCPIIGQWFLFPEWNTVYYLERMLLLKF